MPHKINPKKWQEVYEESLLLLKSEPDGVMGLNHKCFGFANRRYYSREIESYTGEPEQRRWHVVGDMKSKKSSESFLMYYDLNYYREKICKPERSRNDILYSKARDKKNYTTVFSSKTQGYPYHHFILAVASLVESRFPSFALATGDIDRNDSQKAVSWANRILKDKIEMPVCTDNDRLRLRLKKYFKDQELTNIFEEFSLSDYSNYLYYYGPFGNFDDGNIFKTIRNFDSINDFLKVALKLFSYQIKIVQKDSMELLLREKNLWKRIVKLAEKRRIVVTESAWDWIDNEEDIDMLWVLLSLTLINEDEITFCCLRRAVFENRNMCREIVRLMNDDKEMSEVTESIWKKEFERFASSYLKRILFRRYEPELY
jgi:hypothetical protein